MAWRGEARRGLARHGMARQGMARRGEANNMHTRRQYDTPRWRKARARFLALNPLCVLCLQSGWDTPATVVDHMRPHNGDDRLFWDEGNWQALCPSCHSGVKRIQEHHGHSQACDIDGLPLDREHRWSK